MIVRLFFKVLLSLTVLYLGRRLYRRARRACLKSGAVALITGGGSGVGLELAKCFARAGARVVLVGRNESALKSAADACVSAGATSAHYIIADLSTAEGVQHVRTTFESIHGDALKYLILNAGAGAIAPFSSDERFGKICDEMMMINYYSNVRLLQTFLPQLLANDSPTSRSRIIVMSSLAGVLPSIMRSAYTASKHAIQGFMNALRGEIDIPITLCCPGYVDTDFHQRVLTADGRPLPGHQRRGVPPSQCAQECLDGSLSGDAEVIMTPAGILGYRLRPWLTGIVDVMAKRKSLQSIEAKGE